MARYPNSKTRRGPHDPSCRGRAELLRERRGRVESVTGDPRRIAEERRVPAAARQGAARLDERSDEGFGEAGKPTQTIHTHAPIWRIFLKMLARLSPPVSISKGRARALQCRPESRAGCARFQAWKYVPGVRKTGDGEFCRVRVSVLNCTGVRSRASALQGGNWPRHDDGRALVRGIREVVLLLPRPRSCRSEAPAAAMSGQDAARRREFWLTRMSCALRCR